MLYYRMRNFSFKKVVRISLLMYIFAGVIFLFIASLTDMPFLVAWCHFVDSKTLDGSLLLTMYPSSTVLAENDPDFMEPAVGVLTSPYGERWGRTHEGIDIGNSQGSEILATESGVVRYAGWVDGYGNYIKLEHKNGFSSAYGHCDTLLVSDGDTVKKGDKIATMGNTGNSTGPHLHFEILYDEEPQNPLNYVTY